MEFDLNHSRSVEATVKKPHDQSEIKENKSQLSMLSTETEKNVFGIFPLLNDRVEDILPWDTDDFFSIKYFTITDKTMVQFDIEYIKQRLGL